MINPFMTFKKKIQISALKPNLTQNKKLTRVQIYFSQTFKV
jgi:hypothetical protein